MKNAIKRRATRAKRKMSIRKKIQGTSERPRLSVFRSARHIYVQVINDENGQTLVSASTLDKELGDVKGDLDKSGVSQQVGALAARRCLEKSIDKVVFDRNGFIYHGRIKALADGAREAGLNF